MSTSEDPNLLELFSQAEQDFQDDSFAEDVLQQIDRERRKTLLLWFALFVLAFAGLALLASPAIATIAMATRLLPVSLVEVETEWLRLLLSPINSVAAAIALAALGIRKFFRWILR